MNTHEQYISLETAKLLKKVGFDWEVYSFYDTNYKDILFTRRVACVNWNMSDSGYMFSAPTQAVAMRWLREVNLLNVEIETTYSSYHKRRCFRPAIRFLDEYYAKLYLDGVDTYEQAAEEAIQECLKVILNK